MDRKIHTSYCCRGLEKKNDLKGEEEQLIFQMKRAAGMKVQNERLDSICQMV